MSGGGASRRCRHAARQRQGWPAHAGCAHFRRSTSSFGAGQWEASWWFGTWLLYISYFSINLGNFIIPIDFQIVQRGRVETTIQEGLRGGPEVHAEGDAHGTGWGDPEVYQHTLHPSQGQGNGWADDEGRYAGEVGWSDPRLHGKPHPDRKTHEDVGGTRAGKGRLLGRLLFKVLGCVKLQLLMRRSWRLRIRWQTLQEMFRFLMVYDCEKNKEKGKDYKLYFSPSLVWMIPMCRHGDILEMIVLSDGAESGERTRVTCSWS